MHNRSIPVTESRQYREIITVRGIHREYGTDLVSAAFIKEGKGEEAVPTVVESVADMPNLKPKIPKPRR